MYEGGPLGKTYPPPLVLSHRGTQLNNCLNIQGVSKKLRFQVLGINQKEHEKKIICPYSL